MCTVAWNKDGTLGNASGHFILRLSMTSVQFLFNSRRDPNMRPIGVPTVIWYHVRIPLWEFKHVLYFSSSLSNTAYCYFCDFYIWIYELNKNIYISFKIFRLRWFLLTVNHGTGKRWFVLSEERVQSSTKQFSVAKDTLQRYVAENT
jgi:hypothetical protein